MIVSNNNFDCDFAKWGLTNDLIKVPHKIEFDLTHQFFLHVGSNMCGMPRDVNGDSGTIRSNLCNTTLATSKSVLLTPMSYLVPIQTPISPSNNTNTEENQTVSTPTVTKFVPTSIEDAQDSSIPPTTTPSLEGALSNRSKGSSDK